jgi:hypothetical protein
MISTSISISHPRSQMMPLSTKCAEDPNKRRAPNGPNGSKKCQKLIFQRERPHDASSSSSALASCRTGVSKPSVNQP